MYARYKHKECGKAPRHFVSKHPRRGAKKMVRGHCRHHPGKGKKPKGKKPNGKGTRKK